MPAQLSVRVNGTAPGEKATLEIMRDGKPMTRDRDHRLGAPRPPLAKNGDECTGGIASRHDAAPAHHGRARTGRRSGGLVVEDASGRAAEAGIQQGDVVLSVNGTPVQSVAQLRSLVHEHDKQVALLIQRGEAESSSRRIGLTPDRASLDGPPDRGVPNPSGIDTAAGPMRKLRPAASFAALNGRNQIEQ